MTVRMNMPGRQFLYAAPCCLVVLFSLATAATAQAPQVESTNESAVATGEPETTATVPVTPLSEEVTAEPQTDVEAPQQLDDVIVTATKREKSAREIPVTINAVHGEDLEKIGARDLKDFIGLVPGITMQEGIYGEAGSRKISIRGVAPADAVGQSGNQTVGLFIGDVPMTDPFSNFVTPDLDAFDLKSVEILKGPQGTTFGASALNGAIRYVPNDPELERWSARGFADYLSIAEGGAEPSYGAAFNAPLGEHIAARGLGVLQNTPGVIDNMQRGIDDADSRRKWSGRGMLRWEASDRLHLNALYLKQQSKLNDLLRASNGDGRLENDDRPGPSTVKVGFELAGLDARYDFDRWGTLVLQSAYQAKTAQYDVDTGIGGQYGLQTLRGFVDTRTHGTTHELRLVSPDGGDWNWIGGLFLMNYSAHAYGDVYVANTAILGGLAGLPGAVFTPRGLSSSSIDITPAAKETSAYGELTRRLGERWELTLGARYYKTSLDGEEKVYGPLTVGYLSGTESQFAQHDNGLSPKVSLAFKLDKNLMAYTTIARGFQFGGVNAPPLLSLPYNNPVSGVPVPVDFDSSSLWSYEAGVRTDWLERTLRVDMTAFYLDWSHAQFGQKTGGSVADNPYIANVGKVASKGVEASLAYLTPIPGLSLNVAASYIRAQTAAPYDDGSGNVIPVGSELPASPKVQTASSVNYSTLLGPWTGNAALTHIYCGPAINGFVEKLPIYDFHTFNLNLAAARPDWSGTPSLTLGVTNLTDARTVQNRTAQTATVPVSWTYGRPRAISLRFSVDFN